MSFFIVYTNNENLITAFLFENRYISYRQTAFFGPFKTGIENNHTHNIVLRNMVNIIQHMSSDFVLHKVYVSQYQRELGAALIYYILVFQGHFLFAFYEFVIVRRNT